MICIRCAEVYPDTQRVCPKCKAVLHRPTYVSIRALMKAREAAAVRESLADWQARGLIDAETANRLLAPATPAPTTGPAPTPVRNETPVAESSLSSGGATQAAAVAAQVFDAASPGLEAAVGGIAVLAALDSAPAAAPRKPTYFETAVWPVLYENIGWFIGALFVLAGSVYGLREAWGALGSGARHALVAGALFAYHAGFVGLSILLARRAAGASRVLGSIAVGLLPMSFAAVGGLRETTLPGVILATLALAGLASLTLGSVGRRFEFGRFELTTAMLPSLVTQAALAGAAGRAWLPIVGLGCVAWSLRTTRGARREALTLLALYGALALEITAAVGGVQTAPLQLRLVLYGTLGATAFSQDVWRQRWKQLAPALDVACLGVAATAAIVSTVKASSVVDLASVSVASVLFFFSSRRHPRSLHVAVLLGAAAGGVLGWLTSEHRLWSSLYVSLYGATGLQAMRWPASRGRTVIVRWSVAFAVAGFLFIGGNHPGADSETTPVVLTALLVAVSAFVAGGLTTRSLHYLGSFALLLAGTELVSSNDWGVAFVLGASLAFALAGFAIDALTARRGLAVGPDVVCPFDDVSLLLLFLAVPVALTSSRYATVGILAAGIGLLLRAWLDGSRLLSAAGATLIVWRIVEHFGYQPIPSALVAVTCFALASLRGNAAVAPHSYGRKIFGTLRLPLPAPLRILWTDGLAAAGLFAVIIVAGRLVEWLPTHVASGRAAAVDAAALCALLPLIAFLTPACLSIRGRGSVAALAILAGALGLVGALYRVGRPLSPSEAFSHLTLLATGVWLVALALRRWGPALATRLDHAASGPRYHFVPHVGVAVIGVMLALRVVAESSATLSVFLSQCPPTLLFGAAWCAALLARSSRRPGSLQPALLLALLGSAQTGAQLPAAGDIFTGAQWGIAAFGIVSAGLTFGLAERWGVVSRGGAWVFVDDDTGDQRARLAKLFAGRGTLAAGAILMFSLWQPVTLAAGLGIGTGFLLVTADRSAVPLLVLSAAALLHSVAQHGDAIPFWTGPGLSLVGAAILVAAPLIAGRRRSAMTTRASQSLATFLFLLGLIYALAEGGATSLTSAGVTVLSDVAVKVETQWYSSPALAASLLLIAAACAVLAVLDRRAGITTRLARLHTMSVLIGSVAILLGLPEFVDVLRSSDGARGLAGLPPNFPMLTFPRFIAEYAWEMAPVAAALALAAHAWNRGIQVPGAPDVESGRGLREARDWLLFLVAGLVTAAMYRTASPALSEPLSLMALVLVGVMSTHVAWRERTALHVYAVQLSAVGIYVLIREGLLPGPQPEIDACAALALGFVLLGVTVGAKRAGIPPVATATRRFAAALPLAIAFVTPFHATVSAALLAAGAGALWSALSWIENSKAFGSLGAAAVNLALFTAALSAGLSGVEIYVAPFGLMTLALGQIFATSLEPGQRQMARIIGSLLVYLPAAAQLASQVSSKGSGEYSVGFGLVCLLGVAAGMVFHLRAYLALGTGFLVLDVIANLLHAGIRDHRIGFLLLSLAGLGILGVMIFVTLQRDFVQRTTQRWRARLAGWE